MEKKNSIIAKYGNSENFLKVFNPDMQVTYCRYIDKCYLGTSPTLYEVSEVYGKNISKSWMFLQICNLSEFSNNPNKINVEQAKELAAMLVEEYKNYKVTEFMLFFYRFKLARYDSRFYHSIDPITIAKAFKEFVFQKKDEVWAILQRREEERRERAYQQRQKEAVSYEEYLRLKSLKKL